MSALPGETEYEWHDIARIAYQRACDACDKGLIYAPVRFCGKCGGSGYLLRFEERRMTPEEAIAQLDAIQQGDTEVNHGEADDILLQVVPAEVAEAYARVQTRAGYFWYA